MTKAEKKKLIGTNAALWTAAILLSFILPLVAESITDGRGAFLKMMSHIFPLLATVMISSGLISKAIGEPPE